MPPNHRYVLLPKAGIGNIIVFFCVQWLELWTSISFSTDWNTKYWKTVNYQKLALMSNSNVKLVSLFTQTVIYRPWMKSKSKQIARLSLFYLGARLVNVLMFGHLTFKNFTLMSSSQVKTVNEHQLIITSFTLIFLNSWSIKKIK